MKLLNIRFLSILFASLFIILAGCATTAKTSEEQVVKDILFAMAQADVDKYINNVDLSGVPEAEVTALTEKLPELMTELKTTEIDPKGGIESVEITDKTFSEDGNNASIDFVVTYGNGTTENGNMAVIKVNDVWKVRLN